MGAWGHEGGGCGWVWAVVFAAVMFTRFVTQVRYVRGWRDAGGCTAASEGTVMAMGLIAVVSEEELGLNRPYAQLE